MVGYVFGSYLKEVPKASITKINLTTDKTTINKATTSNISLAVEPPDAPKDGINWSSSNTSIVIVDNLGIITAVSSGTATITASKGDIKQSIDITVYSPVTSVILSKETVNLQEGKTLKINANVLPEDATNKTIVWNSSDTKIASVQADGTITANSVGEVKITAKTEDGVEAVCNVTVKEKPAKGLVLDFNTSLNVEGDEVTRIDIQNSKVQNIVDLITTNLNLEFYSNDNRLLIQTDQIGTGTKLIARDDNENIIYEYEFIVYGDVNGDGLINSLDVLVLQKHILETKLLTGIFLKSGNISKNGSIPSSLDVLKVQKHILESKFIEQ